MKGLETDDVAGLRGPGLGAPEEGGKDFGFEDGDLGVDGDVLPSEEGSGQGPEGLVGLGEANRDLRLESRLGGESAAEIRERSESLLTLLLLFLLLFLRGWGDDVFEGDATEGDGGLAVNAAGVDGEKLGFRLVDGEKEELSGAFKSINKALQTLSGVADNSHVIRIKEDLEKEVELARADRSDTKLAIDSVAENHTVGGVGEGNANDVVKEDCKESRSKNTALTYAVVSEERLGEGAVGPDRGMCVRMKVFKEAKDFGGDSGALADEPERRAVDLVIGLEEVDEASVDRDVKLKGTAENLAEDEDLICGTAGFAEARLVLKNGCLQALRDTSKESESIDFPGDREEADSTVTATLQSTTLTLIDRYNDGVFPVLG